MPNLLEKRQALLKEAQAITMKAISEDRNLSEDERQAVDAKMAEAKAMKSDMELVDRITEEIEAKAQEGQRKQKREGKGSFGRQFVESDIFKSWLDQVAPSGHIPDRKRLSDSPSFELKGMGLKTLLTGGSSTSGGAFIVDDDTGIYESLGRYPTSVLDLVSRRQTESDVVAFVRQTAQVTQAAPTAEANVTTYAEGQGEVEGAKPEGAMAFERVTANVYTIPVWVPATKQSLADASQLRGIIDEELREDCLEELDDQILNGDGTTDLFTGLYNASNVLGQAYSTDKIQTARKAITNLMTNGKTVPTAWVMHPNDWEAYDLLKDGDNRYYRGGPFQNGPNTQWTLPVVTYYHATEGTPILGNWNKLVVWDREQITISVSDSHEDFFIRNMVAILGELRAAIGILRPTAFCEVSLSAS